MKEKAHTHTVTHTIHKHILTPTRSYIHTLPGKKAQSVGAQLRRYGEQQTREDVQKLLGEW